MGAFWLFTPPIPEINMGTFKISVYLLFTAFLITGCSSKHQEQQAADQAAADEFAKLAQTNKERVAEQIESGDGSVPESTDSIDEYVELVEKASENVSPELAAQLKSQAAILKEFKELADPYLAANNKFMELGGIDAATLASIEDIDNRIAMIDELAAINEVIDVRYRELFMQITGSDTPEGARQLAMIKEIRQTDREAYPHMKQCLQIVKEHWETSGNANDGLFYFGADVPSEDIAQYNQHLKAIEAIGVKQQQIQRDYYNVP